MGSAQHIERDGERCRFIAGVFGIFGHGNVAGLGEALEAEAATHPDDALRYLQARNEQGMVHAAAAYSKQLRRMRTYACTTSIGPLGTEKPSVRASRLDELVAPESKRKPAG